MLQSVQVQPHRRAARRHAVDLECTVLSEVYGEPIPFRIRDISADGLFAVSDILLEPGDEVVIELPPPRLGEPLCILGRVNRTEAAPAPGFDPGMGISFDHGDSLLRSILAGSLKALPPPLPRVRPQVQEEQVWVECLLTWEEDLGDQVNVWEVSELLCGIDDELEDAFEALAPCASFMHAPRRIPWLAA
ncbi:MAG: hypothetical protein CMN30_19595 [Sandaracinus sp.]|nr:hypothetical protein [Sandaracinus sp.]